MRAGSVVFRQLTRAASQAPAPLSRHAPGRARTALCSRLPDLQGRRAFTAGGPSRIPPHTAGAAGLAQPPPLAPTASAPLDDRKDAPKAPPPPSSSDSVGAGVLAAAVVSAGSFALADAGGAALMAAQGIVGAGSPISGVPVAVLTGLALNNLRGAGVLPSLSPAVLKPGLQLCLTRILRVGIVCVGAKLSFGDVAALGAVGLPVVLAAIGSGLVFVPWLAGRLGLPPRLGLLTAAGSSICGVTAIVSLAPAIGATDKETAIAVANVVAFGLFGMLTYPYLAHACLDSPGAVGMFLGTAVHDTSQVVGAALTYSQLYSDPAVVKVAAVTKLTRNMFLAAVIPALAWVNARNVASLASTTAGIAGVAPSATGVKLNMKAMFPAFVLGFVGMAALRSLGDATLASSALTHGAESARALGLLDASQWRALTTFVGDDVSKACLGTAMAALGLNTSLSVFKGVGPKPFLLGFAGAAVVAGVGFACAAGLGAFLPPV